MDLEEQDRSGKKKHAKAREEGKTCIDCHKGLAHEYPSKPKSDAVAAAR
jgi:cytochrome c-type protein NapC